MRVYTNHTNNLLHCLPSFLLSRYPPPPPVASVEGDSDASSSMSLSDHFERKSRTNDLFQYVFSSVAGKKGHVVIDDVIQWDFTQVRYCTHACYLF